MRRPYFSALAARVFSTLVTLAAGAFTIRLYGLYLSPAELGSIAIPVQLFTYLPLVDLGFRLIINRHLLIALEPVEQQQLIRFGQQITFLMFCLAPVSAAILFSASGFVHSLLWGGSTIGLYTTMGIAAGISVALTAQASLLIGLGAQSLSFLLAAIIAVVQAVSIGMFFKAGWGLWALPASLATANILCFPIILLCLSRWLTLRDLVPFEFEDFGEFFTRYKKEALSSLQSQISIILLFTIDVILASLLFPPKEAGVYFVLSRIFAYARSFLQIPSEIAWPFLARHSDRAAEWTSRLLHMNAWLQGAAYATLATVLPSVIHWYLGPAWTASSLLFFCISIRFLLIGNTTPASYYLLAQGAFTVINRNVQREMLVGAILGVVLGHYYGLFAFSIGFLISPLCGTALPMLAQLSAHLGQTLVGVAGKIWLRTAIAFSATALGSFWLQNWPSPPSLPLLVLAPAICGAAAMLSFAGIRILLARIMPSRIMDENPREFSLLRITRWL